MPFLSPGDLPDPEIKLRSPTLWADSLTAEPQGKPKNTGVGSLSFCQGIIPTQVSNQGLLHFRWILYQLSYQGRFPGEGIGYALQYSASLVTQTVKNLPVIWETWVRSLGWEDILEKEVATHSSILAWRIPGEPGGLQSIGSERVRLD